MSLMKWSLLTAIACLIGASVDAQDLQYVVGSTSDPVRWPGNEDPSQAINWAGQKYLNFEGEVRPSGFYVRPEGPNADDIATSITFWAANDAIPRDPASFQLFGSNSSELLAPLDYFHEDTISQDLWTLIAGSDLMLPDSRNPGGAADLDDMNSQTVEFENTVEYDNYLVMFPTVKNPGGANSMQIAEVQLNYDGVDIANGIFDLDDEITGVALFDLNPDKGDPVGDQPAPTLGNWSIREFVVPDAFGSVDSVETAIAFTEDERIQGSNFVFDGQSNIINHRDPQGGGGGYSVNLDKLDFVSNSPAADDDFIMRARGRVIIPSTGEYTFGVDGDDGFRLSIDGEVLSEVPGTTGNAFTLATANLSEGEHDVELIWFERGGGAFVELFAAPGDKAELDASFSPVGLPEAIPIATGSTPTTTGDWAVHTVQVDTGVFGQVNSIETAAAAVALADDDPGVLDSIDTEEPTVNYGTTDGAASGRFRGDEFGDGEKIAFEVSGNDFAISATNTVVIAEDGDYIFGFGGDDGGRLCIDGADFTLLAQRNAAQGVSGEGECIEWAGNTGNSDTYGTTFLPAGEYDVSMLWWERGGGEWLEVYTGVGDSSLAVSTLQLLGDESVEYDLVLEAGLQLAGEVVEITCEEIAASRLVGDADGNGEVDFSDFLTLSGNFNTEGVGYDGGDFDCDGTVAFNDFLLISGNFGATSEAAASVPEPAGFAMLGAALSLIGLLRRRRV